MDETFQMLEIELRQLQQTVIDKGLFQKEKKNPASPK